MQDPGRCNVLLREWRWETPTDAKGTVSRTENRFKRRELPLEGFAHVSRTRARRAPNGMRDLQHHKGF